MRKYIRGPNTWPKLDGCYGYTFSSYPCWEFLLVAIFPEALNRRGKLLEVLGRRLVWSFTLKTCSDLQRRMIWKKRKAACQNSDFQGIPARCFEAISYWYDSPNSPSRSPNMGRRPIHSSSTYVGTSGGPFYCCKQSPMMSLTGLSASLRTSQPNYNIFLTLWQSPSLPPVMNTNHSSSNQILCARFYSHRLEHIRDGWPIS